MSLDSCFQYLAIDLRCLDVCMPEHSGNIFNGYVVRQSQGRKTMSSQMESQTLFETALYLNDMEIVVCFLISDTGKFVIVFLQDIHRRFQDGSIELGSCLQTFTVDVV